MLGDHPACLAERPAACDCTVWHLTGILMGFVLGGSVAIELMALTAPIIAPYDPLKANFRRMAKPPDGHSRFGTDEIGLGSLSRVIYGVRSSLFMAFGAAFLGTAVALLWRLASGHLERCAVGRGAVKV